MSTFSLPPARKGTRKTQQRGVVMLISLIMLVVMTLGALALFRQVSTGLLIAGNLTYRNAALMASDSGASAAVLWLQSAANLDQANLSFVTAPFAAYYPAWCNISYTGGIPDANGDGNIDDCKATPAISTFDPKTYAWAGASVQVTPDDGNGNEIRYVIHRLCRIPGPQTSPAGSAVMQECVVSMAAGASNNHEAVSYGTTPLGSASRAYYRITTRTMGPRNTVVYTQTVIY